MYDNKEDKYKELINSLIYSKYLKTPSIIKAFKKFPRRYFVPQTLTQYANENQPLPIGSGQTISQPLTVAFMIELLQPKAGDKILEIGAGSGWQTAILSDIVGEKGKILAFEIVKSLAEFGKKNLKKFKLDNVCYKHGDALKEYKECAPFNKIISGAAFEEIPDDFRKQLEIGGRLVAPTQKEDIVVINRLEKEKYKVESHYGFVFVPIVSKS